MGLWPNAGRGIACSRRRTRQTLRKASIATCEVAHRPLFISAREERLRLNTGPDKSRIGKSRLAEAFRLSLEDERHTRLRYFCSAASSGQRPFPVHCAI